MSPRVGVFEPQENTLRVLLTLFVYIQSNPKPPTLTLIERKGYSIISVVIYKGLIHNKV
jgi:hypothetical protein